MKCEAFLDKYSEFRDGQLSESDTGAVEEHLAACASCARYDRVVSAGVDLLVSIPPTQSAGDFMPRLRHRLYNVDDGIYRASRRRLGGSAALIGVASVGMLALLWLPFATRVPIEFELPAVAATHGAVARRPVPALFLSEPFVTTVDSRIDVWDLDAKLTQWPPQTHVHPTILIGSTSAQLVTTTSD